jgi:hypothetical protein
LLTAITGSEAEGQPSARQTKLYRLDYLYLHQGDQGNRVNQFLSSQMALLTRNIRTLGIFTATIGHHLPLTMVLSGFSDFAEMEASEERLRKDPGYQAAFAEMEKAPEPPFESYDRVLLRATDFCPEVVPLREKPKTPRVFELRVYHPPTERQLRHLHERFAGPEISIFHRCGIQPIFYANTIAGSAMPNLTSLTPFASLADREKAWDAFGADPAWLKARAESVAKGGQIIAQSSITLLRPAPFSPIQ